MTARQRVNYAMKVAVAYGLYYSGLLFAWQRVVLRRRAVVLMYHRVLTSEERARTASHPALVVGDRTFAMQMSLLKRRFTVLSVAELADRLERKVPLPDSSCVVTFDDGWRDNFTNAMPILDRLGLPALVFLPVNFVGTRRVFWQEALTHLLVSANRQARRCPDRRTGLLRLLEPVGLTAVLELEGKETRAAILQLVDAQKRLTRDAVLNLVNSLASELEICLEDLAAVDGFIDWQQAGAMARQGVTFGAHGAEHLLLTHVSADEAEAELRVSGAVVESKLQPPVLTFSYPNGYHTASTVEQARTAGYRLAFITRRGFVECDDDPLTIRRMNVHEAVTATRPMFMARLVGIL